MSSLSTAELAIYAAFSLPVLYLLFKHGIPGSLGWGYLFLFCSLRVIGGALFLADSSAAVIVSNIGLSPLLLSAAGIHHEAVTYRQRNLNAKLEWVKVLQYHFLVTAGLALLAVGLSGLQSADPTANDAKMVKIGAGILTASWAILMIWSLYSLCWAAASKDSPVYRLATRLLIAVIVALVFIGIRVIYTLVALTSNDAKLNPATGSLAIRVVLSFLPELIAVIIFLIAGLYSRSIRDLAKGRPEPAYELRGKA
ncbi:hypothetical protein FDECE_6295 [Fusarium decemcellulare]|nr:hypothetical protein FDECE_6295 [Fusarium decemcellulare]